VQRADGGLAFVRLEEKVGARAEGVSHGPRARQPKGDGRRLRRHHPRPARHDRFGQVNDREHQGEMRLDQSMLGIMPRADHLDPTQVARRDIKCADDGQGLHRGGIGAVAQRCKAGRDGIAKAA
jgi:hypothetical protein